ncbi:hypothetical protein LRU_00118 [Ligilactobacillus ruminis SPM0211]|uniref:Uncharacterized protein n=1 Tax=Ligilactobacillus ruminis SPM0211 TaxID=1040964 RepID=F7QXG4_9LACO|nr:hypothetical protein LRU_00118 [Ligilactobacillus ruminis SPM0211]
MQRLLNQRAKLPVKCIATLFLIIFIMEGDRPVCEKNRIRFPIDCKSSGFSI